MMQVLKRWRVRVVFDVQRVTTFYVYDNFLNNVVRKVGDLSWSKGLEPDPVRIEIEADLDEPPNGITTTGVRHG